MTNLKKIPQNCKCFQEFFTYEVLVKVLRPPYCHSESASWRMKNLLFILHLISRETLHCVQGDIFSRLLQEVLIPSELNIAASIFTAAGFPRLQR